MRSQTHSTAPLWMLPCRTAKTIALPPLPSSLRRRENWERERLRGVGKREGKKERGRGGSTFRISDFSFNELWGRKYVLTFQRFNEEKSSRVFYLSHLPIVHLDVSGVRFSWLVFFYSFLVSIHRTGREGIWKERQRADEMV